jgi:hypothetical protein
MVPPARAACPVNPAVARQTPVADALHRRKADSPRHVPTAVPRLTRRAHRLTPSPAAYRRGDVPTPAAAAAPRSSAPCAAHGSCAQRLIPIERMSTTPGQTGSHPLTTARWLHLLRRMEHPFCRVDSGDSPGDLHRDRGTSGAPHLTGKHTRDQRGGPGRSGLKHGTRSAFLVPDARVASGGKLLSDTIADVLRQREHDEPPRRTVQSERGGSVVSRPGSSPRHRPVTAPTRAADAIQIARTGLSTPRAGHPAAPPAT